MVRRFALTHRAARSARGAGPIAVPGIAANLRARILGVQWERKLACPTLSGLAQRYGVGRDTLIRPVGCGARKLVHSGAVGHLGPG